MARDVDPRIIGVGVALPLVIAGGILLASVRGGDDRPPATTTSSPSTSAVEEAWEEAVGEVVAPLDGVLVDLARTVDAWSNGVVGDDDLAAVLDRAEVAVAEVEASATALPDLVGDELARPLVMDMARLYVASVRAHRWSLTASGQARVEYDRLGRRLRILADRTFDRARERTSAPVDPGPDVTLVLPAEVPDWERLEIAAGPPLEPIDPNRADAVPLERLDQRAAQPEVDWRDAVDVLDVPTAQDVRSVRADSDALGALARRLVAAAEALRNEPVPDGDRGRADRLALGWLIRADGARAAQLAVVGGDDELARSLLALSEDRGFSAR